MSIACLLLIAASPNSGGVKAAVVRITEPSKGDRRTMGAAYCRTPKAEWKLSRFGPRRAPEIAKAPVVLPTQEWRFGSVLVSAVEASSR